MNKTKNTLLATMLIALSAGAAAAGPDFVGDTHGPKPLAASESTRPIWPADDVAFAHDSYALQDTSIQQIATVARWMNANPRYKLVLEGHADASGDALYNDDLAARRAELVRQHLLGHGVHPDRILVVVYGEAKARTDVNPVDRRVVLFATAEPLEVIARRVIAEHRANHAMWTRRGVQFTETRGARGLDADRTVATR